VLCDPRARITLNRCLENIFGPRIWVLLPEPEELFVRTQTEMGKSFPGFLRLSRLFPEPFRGVVPRGSPEANEEIRPAMDCLDGFPKQNQVPPSELKVRQNPRFT
jgi:hypothetical protein